MYPVSRSTRLLFQADALVALVVGSALDLPLSIRQLSTASTGPLYSGRGNTETIGRILYSLAQSCFLGDG